MQFALEECFAQLARSLGKILSHSQCQDTGAKKQTEEWHVLDY